MPSKEQHEDEVAECVLVAEEVGVSEKTGTLFTSVVHIMTCMLGMGVLAMPLAMGTLGWIAGPAVLVLFICISSTSTYMLAGVYEVGGYQHPRYHEAVEHLLGRKFALATATCQFTTIFLTCIAYNITAAMSMRTLANLSCGLDAAQKSEPGDDCFNTQWIFAIIFGVAQALFAQLRTIEASWLMSAMGAVTAAGFSLIALGLSISEVAQGNVNGSIAGIPFSSTADKVFNVMSSLGTFGFAFSFSLVLLEIQDTVMEMPKSKVTIRRASRIALLLGAIFYGSVSVTGYMAFGDAVPDNLLMAFHSPKWLVMVANAMVILQMSGSYNLLAQAFFMSLEGWVAHLLGLHHRAEGAALELAGEALADDLAAGSAEDGQSIKGDSMKLGDSQPGSESSDVMAAAAAAVAEVRRRPQRLTRARLLRRGDAQVEATLKELISPKLLHPSVTITPRTGGGGGAGGASVKVKGLAGPMRMMSALRDVDMDDWEAAAAAGPAKPGSGPKARKLDRLKSLAAVPEDEDNEDAGNGQQKGQATVVGFERQSAERSSFAARHPVALSVIIRCTYVLVITLLAVVTPFFGSVAGLIGAITYFPLEVFFPFTMYMAVHPEMSRHKRAVLYSILLFTFVVAAGAAIGAMRNILQGWTSFEFN